VRLNLAFHVSLEAFTKQVRKLRLEGIVAKRADSIYIPGKESDAWRKHRFNQEGEFVIGGYISGGQYFSELLIGEERDEELVLNSQSECPYLRGFRRVDSEKQSEGLGAPELENIFT